MHGCGCQVREKQLENDFFFFSDKEKSVNFVICLESRKGIEKSGNLKFFGYGSLQKTIGPRGKYILMGKIISAWKYLSLSSLLAILRVKNLLEWE